MTWILLASIALLAILLLPRLLRSARRSPLPPAALLSLATIGVPHLGSASPAQPAPQKVDAPACQDPADCEDPSTDDDDCADDGTCDPPAIEAPSTDGNPAPPIQGGCADPKTCIEPK